MQSYEFLKKYFTEADDWEFPGSRAVTHPLAINEYWIYVDSTYLNGFINRVEILKAFSIDRYFDPVDEPIELSYQRDDKWQNAKFTDKDSAIDFIRDTNNTFFHTDISELMDDCVVLSTVEDNPNMYVVFCFDRDVSDCCIGRFETDVPREKVLSDFVEWAMSLSEDNRENGLTGQKSREIPLRWFKGWISF